MSVGKMSEVEWLNVSELVEDPANVRVHDQRNLEAIRGSLARFGQQKPIVVSMDGVVVAGNGTLEAARRLGWDTIGVVRTRLEGSDRTAYAIADNRAGELAEWDDEALAKQLNSLADEDEELLASVGFDYGDLQKFEEDAKEEVAGTVNFTEELMECQNYIVLLFEHEIDWLAAQDHFEIETKDGLQVNAKGEPLKRGLGRVVRGGEYLAKVLRS